MCRAAKFAAAIMRWEMSKSVMSEHMSETTGAVRSAIGASCLLGRERSS